ncbi:hypothetical protein BKA82DRAFT_28787 [Pisolithus tinctorius]|nr:hypothetical protein BKA82DRAFT_28787 [Pisolithus tinctorius]
MSSSSSHKLFKKSPELDAAANRILQIYFKDIAESSKLGRQTRLRSGEDSVHDLIARTDEIPMTLIGVDMFLKWHEDLGSINHPWPEWKTALAPSKTDIANHKWLDIVERQYDYHRLASLCPMWCQHQHHPLKRPKCLRATKENGKRPRWRWTMRATAETDDEDDVSAQGQSKRKPSFRRTPSPDPKSCESCRRRKVRCYRNPGKSCFLCDGRKIRCNHAKGGTTAPTR